MKQLLSCTSCDGFLPAGEHARCPHCGATSGVLGRLAGVAATLATAAAFSSTLMACYGPMPYREQVPVRAEPTPSASAPSGVLAPDEETTKTK